jgi:hypothetical protein
MPIYFKRYYVLMLYYNRLTCIWKTYGLYIWFRYGCKFDWHDEEKYKNIEQRIKTAPVRKPTQENDQQAQKKLTPDSAIETAHVLLSNSKTTDLMKEVDKEVKLANLDATEKFVVFKNVQVYHDLLWTIKEQHKKMLEGYDRYKDIYVKYPECLQDELVVEGIEDTLDALDPSCQMFDKVGLLRMGIFVPVLSRGKGGFERTKQVETISTSTQEYKDKTEQKPGFLGMFGGFKKNNAN